MDMPEPDAPKPNRRRAIIVCTIFAVVLGGIFYYLWTNHAYLKWRFIGSEPGLMSHALETGYITPDQVVTLVNSGATFEVRGEALATIACSEGFRAPYDDRIVDSIRAFAANLPEDPSEALSAANALVAALPRSKRPELIGVVSMLATHPIPFVRMSVVRVFRTDWGLGKDGATILAKLAADQDPLVRMEVAEVLERHHAPEWAKGILRGLLDDSDDRVRSIAVDAVPSFRSADGRTLFAKRLRTMLNSSDEVERVRVAALVSLFRTGNIHSDELAALANDPHARVAMVAKRFLKRCARTEGTPERPFANE